MSTATHRCLLVIVALLVALPGLPPPTVQADSGDQLAAAAVLPSEVSALYFQETSHNLGGGFLRYWWEHGQLALFGYPISEELHEDGRTVQYFERARFEYFPEHAGTRYEVQLGHLGRQVSARRTEAAFRPVPMIADTPTHAYFAATGHTTAHGFKAFWERHDGLANFGYPISEEFREVNPADGKEYTVQYFERARFEYHPEHQGTPYEVLLGHLGRQLALARAVPLQAATPRSAATVWYTRLETDINRRKAQAAAVKAVPAPVQPFQAVVTASSAVVRRAPTTVAPVIASTYARHIVHVTGVAAGESIGGNDRWYQVTPSGGYISATVVQPFTPPAPPRTWPGRWLDVNLSHFYITAYEGSTPRYSAIITAGRNNRTPTGIFTVQRRVRSETMDSTTVGFPRGHPEYYYLTNVEFTQYFTGQGHAVHGNYWVHPSRFGAFSSNGCVGLMNVDAAYFWQFATVGTPIHIHF